MKKNKCMLSIIVPVYNSSKYLPRFLISLIYQKLSSKFEVIFIDDGSTDESVKIINNYCRNRLDYKILSQQNQKQAAARNLGLNNASGKYVYFCDSDDELTVDSLRNMLYAMESSKAELYVCCVKIQFPKKSYVDTSFIFKRPEHLIEKYVTQNTEADVGLWNKCFVNAIIQKHNIHFDNGNFFEDSLFVLRYLSVINLQKIHYSKFIGYTLFKNIGSTTRSFRPEIDFLAKSYLDKAFKLLQSYNFTARINTGLRNRVYLHVLHHHILYDRNFVNQDLKRYVREHLSFRQFGGMVTLKYKISIYFVLLFPQVYSAFYYRWKG